jgi:hypothetical protein
MQVASHAAIFREGPRAWIVLARNAVPVAGVYAFGWSSDIAILNYWWDGVSMLAALVAVVVYDVDRDKPFPAGIPPRLRVPLVAFCGLLMLGLLGIPYWFALLWLSHLTFHAGTWAALTGNISVIVGFVGIAIGNYGDIASRGIAGLPEKEQRRMLSWEFNLLLARAAAMMLVAFFFARLFVAVLAIALAYLELYPVRALKVLGAPQVVIDDAPVPRT